MIEKIYIKAEITGVLPSGRKLVHLLANNADGIVFCTDDKSIVRPHEIEAEAEIKYLRKLLVEKCDKCDVTEEKTDAIKEFAERMKEKMNDVARCSFDGRPYFLISTYLVDEIVKEMVGESNEP